jgi:nucleotidyltransferase/DNA polymerase involved in DNA repair
MEKSTNKNKKSIRVKLSASLHEAVKNLGIEKSGKKFEKILEKTSKKLAAEVASRLKKESKKMQKAGTKLKKSKHVEESVAA